MAYLGWVGAGVLTAGVSAALLAGAGTASAEADSSGDSHAGPAKTSTSSTKPDRSAPAGSRHVTPHLKRPDRPARSAAPRVRRTVEREAFEQKRAATPDDSESDALRAATKQTPLLPLSTQRSAARKQLRERLAPLTADMAQNDQPASDVRNPLTAISEVPKTISATAPSGVGVTGSSSAQLPDLIGSGLQSVVNAVGSALFNAVGGVIQAVDGPPTVPPGLRDSVEVSSSTLVVSPGNEVPADWYFPTHGQPDRLIYLQHGFIATGPMYSYTASYLAERTNSVVVVTTVTSNPYTAGGMWLGGDNMHQAVAELFLDPDRKALNASMTTASLKAGQESFTVPERFVLVGHSLGGGFAPGVAGYYAEGLVARRAEGQDAPNDLAGVVLLDGVPPSGSLPAAMDRLHQLEASNGNDPADYVPVYEIGAPLNAFNSTSKVNDELSAARPGTFVGVVVNGGVHMDSMLGGNPLIQAAAYLVAGIPQPQNPPAVQRLMAGWVNDMFEGNIDPVTGRCLSDCNGTYGDAGQTVDIDAGTGNATAVVIDSGTLPDESDWSALEFVPVDASFIPRSVLSRWV
ncbi:alpha/beta fold hydrolase [Mycolicibacterium peregrinum]|uniref:alpha/beta fold hydrolase n=1 Tax=Mycolicibacterium peregrinum TaxID=43304 RepID=UPI000ABCC685|nr:alpha/beta fold hydrolase [Mycolicibacterium peregrinum]